MKQIGTFNQNIIDILELDIVAGTPIYIGERNIAHMKKRHPAEFALYYPRIEDIISEPDYVGKNPNNCSVDFVKLYQVGTEYVQVSVRVDSRGTFFVRTLFVLMSYKAERYIEQGTLKKILDI